MSGLGPTHTIVSDSDNTVVFWRRNIMIQVRRGRLLLAPLEPAIDHVLRLLKAGQPAGGMMIVEAAAPLPDDQTRKAQRELIERITAHPKIRMAAVVLGEDVTSKLQRSASRLISMGDPKVQRFTEIPAAAGWLMGELNPLGLVADPSELAAATEFARGIAAKARG